MRTKLGALLGAGGLLLMAASATIAAPPTYEVSVAKTASPETVPAGGGTVTFTVWVTATGTGFFQTISITDSLAGCTLGAAVETTGNGDTKLEEGETWTYSCVVEGVMPGTTNTATVNACHNVSACNQAAHDAQGQDSVTVTEGEAPPPTDAPPTDVPPTDVPPTDVPPTDVPPTDVPPTDVPPTDGPGSPNHTQDEAGATQFSTDTLGGPVSPARSLRTLLLVLSLGMLLASLVLLTPTRPVRVRKTDR